MGDLEAAWGYGNGEDDYYKYDHPPSYKYEFLTEEDLVSSFIFQKHLTMALSHKERIIKQLEYELLRRLEI